MSYSAVNDGKPVVLGKIGKCHGIKGWVKLHSFTSPPENILDYPELKIELAAQQRELLVTESRHQNSNLLVHFEGYDDPESARELTGLEVWVTDSELPALAVGEYYWHELEGLLVWNEQKVLLGKVSKLLETGANDVLVVVPTDESADKRERLITYIKEQVVKAVDKDAACIHVNWDASYLD